MWTILELYLLIHIQILAWMKPWFDSQPCMSSAVTMAMVLVELEALVMEDHGGATMVGEGRKEREVLLDPDREGAKP